MLEWKKQHKRWTQPPLVQRRVPDLLDEIQHSQSLSTGLKSKSSVDHNGGHIVPRAAIKALSSASLSSTGRSLSDAHLLAASPRGTKLGEVACVMLYRSRGDVSIPDIGRRCPRITTMSLTKCGAMKMGEVEGRDVDGHWEMLVEINLQVYPTCVLVILVFVGTLLCCCTPTTVLTQFSSHSLSLSLSLSLPPPPPSPFPSLPPSLPLTLSSLI